MDQSFERIQWKKNCNRPEPIDNSNRCKQTWMGRGLSKCKNRGILVLKRETKSHKLIRTFGNNICSEIISETGIKSNSSNSDRQQNSYDIYKQNGVHCIKSLQSDSTRSMGLVPQEGHLNEGRIHSLKGECHSRLGVQTSSRLIAADL